MSVRDDIADPILYRLYWGFMLPDICRNMELPSTNYVKGRLHEMHKKHLNYPTTQGVTQEIMGKFLFEVCALWACFGVFVRTKRDQPVGIEWRAFTDLIEINGVKKRVWDLL